MFKNYIKKLRNSGQKKTSSILDIPDSIFSSETSDSEIDALFKTALELTISEGTKTAVLAENEKNTIELAQDWIDLMHLQQEQSTQ